MNNKQIIFYVMIFAIVGYIHYREINVNNKTLLVIIIMLFIARDLIFNNKSGSIEGMANTSVDTEALSNLASMYENGKLKVTDLQVTGNLDVAGNANLLRGRVIQGLWFGPNAGNQRYLAPSGTDNIALNNSGLNINSKDLIVNGGKVRSKEGYWFGTGNDKRRLETGGPGTPAWIDVHDANVHFYNNTLVDMDAHVRGITKTDRIASNGMVGAYIINTGWTGVKDARIPIMEGTGNLGNSIGQVGNNMMDFVIVMPGFRLRLWNQRDTPNWDSAGNLFDKTNTTKLPQMFQLNPANAEDYYRLDMIWRHW